MASQAPVAPADTVVTADPLDPFTSGLRTLRRWGRRTVVALVALAVLGYAVAALAHVETSRWWFASLGDGGEIGRAHV